MTRKYYAPCFFPLLNAFITRTPGKHVFRATFYVTVEGRKTTLYERNHKLLESENGVLKAWVYNRHAKPSKISLAVIELTVRLLTGYPIFIFSDNGEYFFTKYNILGNRTHPMVETQILTPNQEKHLLKIILTPKKPLRERKNQFKDCIGKMEVAEETFQVSREISENIYCFADLVRIHVQYGMFLAYIKPPVNLNQMDVFIKHIYFADRNFWNFRKGAHTFLMHPNPVLI